MPVTMIEKRVFLLAGALLSVWRPAGNLVRTHAFRNDRAGLREFVDYLEEDPETPICFLLDIAEEEFRLETIPHVFGSDRRALLKSRQQRLFRDTPYRHAVFQDREIHGRRDDTVLFAAVTRPSTLQCWLDPIARREIPLVGIYSLPILSKKLLPYIRIGARGFSDYALLVHCNATGTRQSFFYRQHLKVSRLAAASRTNGGGLDHIMGHIPGEVENIRRYLGSLRLLPRDRPLDVYLLGNAETSTRLKPQTTELVNTRYHFVDVAEIGARIGIAGDPASYADSIFAGILLRSTPANHYAPPDDIRCFRAARIRAAMYALSLALLIATIVFGAFQLSELLIIGRETDILAKRAWNYEERYASIEADSPALPADGPALKAMVEGAMALRRSKTTPYPTLFALSEVLDQKRNLEIAEIQWSVGNPDSSIGVPRAKARPGSTPLEPWLTETALRTYRIALIKGRIVEFSDYRDAMISVEDFASALSRIDTVEDVRIIERPLHIGSEERIAGRAGTALTSAPGSANFVLRTVFRSEPSEVIERAPP
uniref:Uncharacterized protein n=1 Tax=Candidatus Kentrum sp. TC TaxID=2126339 RepID=A0A450YKL0_9GAMM|nr:MAG: hypothetical protein BECKTC1821E_GA0114239_101654 [Candidatus Kentron sp. TC]